MAQGISPIANAIESITVELNALESPTLSPETRAQIGLVRTDLQSAKTTVDSIAKDLKESSPKTGEVRNLVVGFPSLNQDSQVLVIVKDLDALIAMPGFPPSQLPQLKSKLNKAGTDTATSFTNLFKPKDHTKSADAVAAERANADMRYPRRVFSQLVNEANIVSISPIAILDTARLWQRGVTGEKIRFGIGPGIRLTIVSLDVTTGYAFNANRQPWEGRGAFVFTMQASNLFR